MNYRFFYLLLLSCTLLGPLPATADSYAIEGLREGDRVEIEHGTVVIYSKSGIGSLTLSPNDSWPKVLRFRFLYQDGKGFQFLEGLTLKTQWLELTGSHQDSDSFPFRFLGSCCSQNSTDGGAISARLSLVKGALELSLPPHFAAHTDTLTIHWVDVYRD